MPKRVNNLQHYYATRPGVPVDESFQRCVEAFSSLSHRTFSTEDLLRKNPAVRQTLCEFYLESREKSAAWRSKYLTCDEFFQESSPLRGRFVIFFLLAHYLPSHIESGISVLDFGILWTDSDIPILQAALDEEKPVPWNRKVRYGKNLFGRQLWELTSSDRELNDEELRLVFLDAIDKERQRFERLRRKFSGDAGAKLPPKREVIAEEVRIFVWRRDGGRCVQCESQERLEFDHIIPVNKGGGNTERNIQLLCEACNRKKRDNI